MIRWCFPVLLVMALLPHFHAAAQSNTERFRAQTDEPGWHTVVAGSATYKQGNVNYLGAEGNLRVGYNSAEEKRPVHLPLFYGTASYAESNGQRFISNSFVHARWTTMWLPTERHMYKPTHRAGGDQAVEQSGDADRAARDTSIKQFQWGTEVYAQAQFDRFLLLQHRVLGGVGFRVRFLNSERGHLYYGKSYMLESEGMDIPETDTHPTTTLNHRFSHYLTGDVQVADNISISQTTFYQPRFDHPADYRILFEVELDVQATKHIAFSTGMTLRHDSDPPDEVQPTDLQTFTRLRAQF